MHLLLLLILLIVPCYAASEDVYQTPEAFIGEAFNGDPPISKVFWISKELHLHINEIMEHNYPVLKIKYWLKDGRSVWVLEEIGKVKPITAGIIVNNGEIEFLKVLIYRESHGWEVKHVFFTDQFKEVTLINGKKLKGKNALFAD